MKKKCETFAKEKKHLTYWRLKDRPTAFLFNQLFGITRKK